MPRKSAGERMEKLETEIEYLKQGQDEIKIKLDKFIESADSKYAEKRLEEEVKSNSKAISKINLTIAKYTGGAVVLLAIVQLALKYLFNV